jgi:hypothetical protein
MIGKQHKVATVQSSCRKLERLCARSKDGKIQGKFLHCIAIVPISALGLERTCSSVRAMSALSRKWTLVERVGMSALCQKRTSVIFGRAARLRLRANPRAILDLVHNWPPAFRAAIALKISAHVGCAPLGFRFRGGLWFSRQLENCGLLTLTQRRQEHDLAIWKLEGIVMSGNFFFVDLPKDRCSMIYNSVSPNEQSGR